MHGIKTLDTVREVYAELVQLQRLHAAVERGEWDLTLAAPHSTANMRFTDEVAMHRALNVLRTRISARRAGLLQLGFDPDLSDPNDDEAQ